MVMLALTMVTSWGPPGPGAHRRGDSFLAPLGGCADGDQGALSPAFDGYGRQMSAG